MHRKKIPEDQNSRQRTDRMKRVGLDAGAVVVGVADVAAFNEFVPSGHRPGRGRVISSCSNRRARLLITSAFDAWVKG